MCPDAEDFRPARAHVVAHRRIPDLGAVLVHEPVPDPGRGLALLARGADVLPQHLVDQLPDRLRLRRRLLTGFALRRLSIFQRLPHRAPVHPVLARQLPDREPLDPRITANLREQLQPDRPHPRPFPSSTTVTGSR